jgi:hypothetical protein
MNKLLILSIPLLFLFCRCASDSSLDFDTPGTHHDYLPGVADAYVYPQDVTASSMEELLVAYQLPADVLERISTAGLIRSFLDYPMLWLLYGASSDSSPIRNSHLVYAHCNSIEELDRRPDRGNALWEYYKEVDPDCFGMDDLPFELGYQLTTLQVLFTREKILSEYDRKTRQEIVALMLQRCKRNTDRQLGTPEVIACIMYNDAFPPAIDLLGRNFTEWFEHFHPTTEKINRLFSIAEEYIGL